MGTENKSKRVAYTGLFAAIAASSCCIPPVIALIVGMGGGASSLSWMEPFRHYLIGLAVVAIGYAWYNYFKLKSVDESDNCGCEVDEKPRWFQTKGFLIAITLFAIISISFPHYAHIFYPDNKEEVIIVSQSNVQTVNFDVKGMTCASCELHVTHAVNELEGVISVSVSYAKASSKVEFYNTITTKEEIEKAINSTGYKVTNKKEN